MFNKNMLCATFASLSFLVRPEGILIIFILSCIYIYNKKYKYVLILPCFPIIWDLLGYIRTGEPLYLITNGYTSHGIYGHGEIYYYIIGLLKYEPIIFTTAIVGFILLLNNKKSLLTSAFLLLYFAFEIFIYMFGIFGAAGFLRYFVPVIPLLAIYSSFGIQRIIGCFNIKNHNAVLALLILAQLCFSIFVLTSYTVDYKINNTPSIDKNVIISGQWIRDNFPSNTIVYTTDPTVCYFGKVDIFHSKMITLTALKNMENNSIGVYDPYNGPFYGVTPDMIENYTVRERFGSFTIFTKSKASSE
jgi:hypothetical protein